MYTDTRTVARFMKSVRSRWQNKRVECFLLIHSFPSLDYFRLSILNRSDVSVCGNKIVFTQRSVPTAWAVALVDYEIIASHSLAQCRQDHRTNGSAAADFIAYSTFHWFHLI